MGALLGMFGHSEASVQLNTRKQSLLIHNPVSTLEQLVGIPQQPTCDARAQRENKPLRDRLLVNTRTLKLCGS
jgi:hypothetical protein